jgi:predicted glycoside hydrolase/deacetylase ChbG (UPF0249 family)
MDPRNLALTGLLLSSLSVPTASAQGTLQEKLGYPKSAHLVILHADDLGMAHTVNTATLEALEKKWISSASILVPCPWFPEVVAFGKAHPEADLGIHLALNSEWTAFRWGPVSSTSTVPSLLDPDGYLPLVEEIVAANAHPDEVERELRAQIEKARTAGIPISHFDSHMGTLHHTPAFTAIYRRLGRQYGMPIRAFEDVPGLAPEDRLLDGVFEMNPGVAPGEWFSTYKTWLASRAPGVYEVILHLAHNDEEMQGATSDHPNWGAAWRQSDFDLVKSPEFAAMLQKLGFTVITWRELARALPRGYKQGP